MPLSNLLPRAVRTPLHRVRHEASALWTAVHGARRPCVQHGPELSRGVPAAPVARAPFPAPAAGSTAERVDPAQGSQPTPPAAAGPRHQVCYRRRNVTLEVTEDDTLLGAALAAGLDLPHACRMGLCGTCKSRLVSGQIHMSEPNALGDEERARGYCLPCVSQPRGPIVLDA